MRQPLHQLLDLPARELVVRVVGELLADRLLHLLDEGAQPGLVVGAADDLVQVLVRAVVGDLERLLVPEVRQEEVARFPRHEAFEVRHHVPDADAFDGRAAGGEGKAVGEREKRGEEGEEGGGELHVEVFGCIYKRVKVTMVKCELKNNLDFVIRLPNMQERNVKNTSFEKNTTDPCFDPWLTSVIRLLTKPGPDESPNVKGDPWLQ